MPDRVTLDVIDRPRGGVRRAMKHAGQIGHATPPGLRALLVLGTVRFTPRPLPAPTPRRIAFLAAWEENAEVGTEWAASFGELCDGSREHWHVEGEVVRAMFTDPWKGWVPDVAGARPLHRSEPALVLISGDLRPRFVPAFISDSARAVKHAFQQPGYLGGLGIASSPLNTTSCSCWRTYEEAREYAFKPGGHIDAMRRDKARGHHTTQQFLRVRPLGERGSLAGAKPFAALLS